ncbi:hypothetical protein [Aliihoeflea sp. PC F10.4]
MIAKAIGEAAGNGAEFGFEAVVEHVADHGHSRRPLRHAAELGMAELRHRPAATTQGLQDDLHRVRGNAMLARKTGYQITFSSRVHDIKGPGSWLSARTVCKESGSGRRGSGSSFL